MDNAVLFSFLLAILVIAIDAFSIVRLKGKVLQRGIEESLLNEDKHVDER